MQQTEQGAIMNVKTIRTEIETLTSTVAAGNLTSKQLSALDGLKEIALGLLPPDEEDTTSHEGPIAA
jgi:hypothetical protein